ncbi:hypothetical protein [Thaumasiovibrio sp. DFM-14]|uniref:hypothetical protein n=1 Tax=Thaumasiovibrio sp. DFM-14 TaxID=3384792 RepID=UPI0039A17292
MKNSAWITQWKCALLLTLCITSISQAQACVEGESTAYVNLVYVENYQEGMSAGKLVQQKVEYLQGVMSNSAFEFVSPINASFSSYPDEEETNLVLTLSANYAGSYEAITQLVNSKDYVSIDISQCY